MSRKKPTKPKPKARKRPEKPDFERALQLHQQGQLADAERMYRALTATQPNDSRPWHLLGRLLHQKGKTNEGITSLQRATQAAPNDTRAWNDLGMLFDDSGAFAEAIACYKRVSELDPQDATAVNNLGVALKSQERFQEACVAFRQAIALDSDDVAALCNLGNTLKRMNDLAAAEVAYRHALSLDSKLIDIYPNLAAVLRRQDKLDEAAEVFATWLKYEPDNPVAQHLQTAGRKLPGDESSTPPRAPAGYVREVFDEFAETFDQHLGRLDYQGPNLIAKALETIVWNGQQNVLDAGCGTGLCGKILKPLSSKLVGVDLSKKMLERAARLKLYDELVESDLVDYFVQNPDSIQLVVSADTFGYFGDLHEVLSAARTAISSDGQLVCTFETGPDIPSVGYRLMKTGRYRHSSVYLQRILAETGFAVSKFDAATLRMEANQAQRCFVVCAGLTEGPTLRG